MHNNAYVRRRPVAPSSRPLLGRSGQRCAVVFGSALFSLNMWCLPSHPAPRPHSQIHTTRLRTHARTRTRTDAPRTDVTHANMCVRVILISFINTVRTVIIRRVTVSCARRIMFSWYLTLVPVPPRPPHRGTPSKGPRPVGVSSSFLACPRYVRCRRHVAFDRRPDKHTHTHTIRENPQTNVCR